MYLYYLKCYVDPFLYRISCRVNNKQSAPSSVLSKRLKQHFIRPINNSINKSYFWVRCFAKGWSLFLIASHLSPQLPSTITVSGLGFLYRNKWSNFLLIIKIGTHFAGHCCLQKLGMEKCRLLWKKCLDVSTPQGPELHRGLCGQQEPVLLLDVSTTESWAALRMPLL
jgi:hypothetical protein